MNSGHERQRREQHERRDEVDRGDPGEHSHRHDAREDDLRQVAREVRLEAVDALHSGRRDLGACGAVAAVGCLRRRGRRARASARRDTSDAARLPATSKPQAERGRAPRRPPTGGASSVETASSAAPSKARATTRASSVAWSSRSTAARDPDRRVDREKHRAPAVRGGAGADRARARAAQAVGARASASEQLVGRRPLARRSRNT